MASNLADSIHLLNTVAMGDAKASLILKNSRLLSVYTGETIPDMQIAVAGDRIAYVGPDAGHTAGPKTTIIDVKNKHVGPGLADPHIHIDQFVMPSEFVKEALLCGVTSLFSDSIDVVSVAGYNGFVEFLRQCEDLPARIFHTIPGGLPVDTKFSKSRTITRAQETYLVTKHKPKTVVGMGEVFSWTKVTARDPHTIRSIKAMLGRHDCIINGHTAGASGKKLNAYIASGILSCHEPTNFEQVLERLRLGMWVMMREGSIRRDLSDIIPYILKHAIRRERLMFCSDGLDPADMSITGHMDHCIRQAVLYGLEPVDAISMASKNCFDYYGMGRDLGGIAPGKLADILIYDDLESFRPSRVFVGGKTVVSNGKLVVPIRKKKIYAWIKKTVMLPKSITSNEFVIMSNKKSGAKNGNHNNTITANTIQLKTEIITAQGSAILKLDKDGRVHPAPDADVWKVAAFDRIHGTGSHSIGFLENFGAAGIGAFASTWSFHENDMVVIGSNDSDMVTACNHLIKNQGGLVVVKSGKVLASMPLQFAGIISTAPFEQVRTEFEEINAAITDAGCVFERPHLIPLFLPFLALPSVRITSGGVIDVKKRRRIQPIKNAAG